MKIAERSKSHERARLVSGEINTFLQHSAAPQVPCATDCSEAGKGHCSRDCQDIAKMLSSDPDKFPIEGKVVPLTYELGTFEGFDTCWSCEGHLRPSGKLWKLPSVWFYCSSVVLLRVLSNAVVRFNTHKLTHANWGVKVTHSDAGNPDTTFALQPDEGRSTVSLDKMQADCETIAKDLRTFVIDEAKSLRR